jgi:outer membrane protein TolC
LARLKAQEETTRAVGAELRPELLGTGTVSGRAGGSPATNGDRPDAAGLVPDVPNWDVGLVLQWPLFDGTVRAREKASRAQEEVRRDEVDAARLALTASIQQAFVAVTVARSALPGLERALSAAVANYLQADARFKAGLGTSVELADAEALRAATEIQWALGRFEVAKTRAAFGRAIAEGI